MCERWTSRHVDVRYFVFCYFDVHLLSLLWLLALAIFTFFRLLLTENRILEQGICLTPFFFVALSFSLFLVTLNISARRFLFDSVFFHFVVVVYSEHSVYISKRNQKFLHINCALGIRSIPYTLMYSTFLANFFLCVFEIYFIFTDFFLLFAIAVRRRHHRSSFVPFPLNMYFYDLFIDVMLCAEAFTTQPEKINVCNS